MKKTIEELILIENKQLNHDNFQLVFQSELTLHGIMPGQFVNVSIPDNKNVFLRRPFSFFNVDFIQNQFSLLVKVLGKGSKTLTNMQAGQKVSIVFPLGKGFTLPTTNDKVLLIGGGSGVAPMLFLLKMSGIFPDNLHFILGAKTKNDHIDISEYQSFGNFYYSTEDGSFGEKGFVTNHSLYHSAFDSFDRIYACGPAPMMKVIVHDSRKSDKTCEVSLENSMACGFGACLCCVEKTISGNNCVCTDGPVFNINELTWQ